MIEIRKATEADAEGLAELNKSFNGVNRATDQMRVSLQNDPPRTETVLVAEDAKTVIGFACFQTLKSVCYDSPWTEITELYVTPTRRRCGTGRALLREAIRQAKEHGASEVFLRTNVSNEEAKSLLQRIGLKPLPHLVFQAEANIPV